MKHRNHPASLDRRSFLGCVAATTTTTALAGSSLATTALAAAQKQPLKLHNILAAS